MPKQILFVITNQGSGGTNRSLQNLLNKLDTSRYKADVFVMAHQGPYGTLFENCTLLARNSFIHALIADLRQQKGLDKVWSIIIKLLAKVTKYKFQDYLFNVTSKKIYLKKDYAAVIAYGEGVPTRFVYNMNHHNKIAWIHCDYVSYLEHNPSVSEESLYKAFNSIVCVSEYTKGSFLQVYPDFTGKVYDIYNILDDQLMKKLAQLEPDIIFDKTKFNIVSIGRIDPIKHLSAIPALAHELIDAGSNICWYIIGPVGTPTEYNLLKENVSKYDVQDCVKLLGEKNNPYCFIINADLIVNTSLSEANPYVINEAKILNVPVVCTNFGSARELINYGVNGYYEPLDKISERIKFLIDNSDKYNSIKAELFTFIYNNDEILSKVYLLINKH
jgi:glycosyltransferase involved in cell wall biosynthesis